MKSLKQTIVESINEGRGNFVKKISDLMGTRAVEVPAEYNKMKGMKEFKNCVDKASEFFTAPEFQDKKTAETLIAGIAAWLGHNAQEINGASDFEYWMDQAGIIDDEDATIPWLQDLYTLVLKIYDVDCEEEFV